MVQSLYECRKFYMFLPLELTLRPSRIYRAILALAQGLALAGIGLAALPLWVKVMAVAALSMGALRLWRENANSARGLRVGQSGQVELLADEWLAAVICGRPVVLPWLVSLTLQNGQGRKHRLTVWPDSTEPDRFRKLRVWLRMGQPDQG